MKWRMWRVLWALVTGLFTSSVSCVGQCLQPYEPNRGRRDVGDAGPSDGSGSDGTSQDADLDAGVQGALDRRLVQERLLAQGVIPADLTGRLGHARDG